MSVVSIGDLFDRAAEFEHRLEAYYATLRDETGDEGIRLLTYYLARHRRHLEKGLEGVDHDQVDHIRKIELKYDVDFRPEKQFHVIGLPTEDVHAQELLTAAVNYDSELVALYRKILEQPLHPEAVALIESLIRLEERDIVMLKKMIAMDYF